MKILFSTGHPAQVHNFKIVKIYWRAMDIKLFGQRVRKI